jgi:DNA-binding NarL/FixJ family response regulator
MAYMVDGRVTVLLGRFEPLVSVGLIGVLCNDRRVSVLGEDLEPAALERSMLHRAPQVAILSDTVGRAELLRLKAAQPQAGLLVLANAPSVEYGLRVLALGATCVPRSASISELLEAIEISASGGRIFLTPGGQRFERRYPDNAHLLTERQMAVLEQLSEGRSNQEIAHALQISVETARTHVAAVLRKLQARRPELIGMPVSRDALQRRG